MRRRPLVLAATAGVLAIAGGTAIAATGGGPLGPVFRGDGKGRQQDLARELAQRLPGVSADQVERALDDLRQDERAERRKAQAKALADELDGVSTADVEKALDKVERQFERARSRGQWPPRIDFAATLAKALGKRKSEIDKALRAAHRKEFDRKLDEAVKDGRITKKQADRIRKRFEDGPSAFRGWHRGFRHGGPGVPGGPGGFGGPGFGRAGFGPGPGGPPPAFQ